MYGLRLRGQSSGLPAAEWASASGLWVTVEGNSGLDALGGTMGVGLTTILKAMQGLVFSVQHIRASGLRILIESMVRPSSPSKLARCLQDRPFAALVCSVGHLSYSSGHPPQNP